MTSKWKCYLTDPRAFCKSYHSIINYCERGIKPSLNHITSLNTKRPFATFVLSKRFKYRGNPAPVRLQYSTVWARKKLAPAVTSSLYSRVYFSSYWWWYCCTRGQQNSKAIHGKWSDVDGKNKISESPLNWCMQRIFSPLIKFTVYIQDIHLNKLIYCFSRTQPYSDHSNIIMQRQCSKSHAAPFRLGLIVCTIVPTLGHHCEGKKERKDDCCLKSEQKMLQQKPECSFK